jgi:hypothetical protein
VVVAAEIKTVLQQAVAQVAEIAAMMQDKTQEQEQPIKVLLVVKVVVLIAVQVAAAREPLV